MDSFLEEVLGWYSKATWVLRVLFTFPKILGDLHWFANFIFLTLLWIHRLFKDWRIGIEGFWGQVDDEIGHFRQKTRSEEEMAGNGSLCLEFPSALEHDWDRGLMKYAQLLLQFGLTAQNISSERHWKRERHTLHGRWFLLSVGKTGGGQTLESEQESSGPNLVRHDENWCLGWREGTDGKQNW